MCLIKSKEGGKLSMSFSLNIIYLKNIEVQKHKKNKSLLRKKSKRNITRIIKLTKRHLLKQKSNQE